VAFHTWSIKVTPDSLKAELEPDPAHRSPLPTVADDSPARPYERRLGFDMVQNGVSFAPGFGGAGAGQLALTDMLGNEQILITLANDSDQFGNFWDGWEGGVTYLNQSRRLYYGIGVYRLTRLYDPDFDVVRREKRLGLLGVVSYPFNPFTRVEATVQVQHATNHLLRSGTAPTVDLVSNFISFVHDDSRWWWDGPTGGSRLNLTAGFTRDMSSGLADYATVLAELRHYRQPIRHVVLAMRGQVTQSFGNDAQRAFVGGPGRLHINQRQVIYGLRMANAQAELRFPLLQNLVVSVPSPWQIPTLHGALFADGAWARGQQNLDRIADGGFAVYLGGGVYPELRWNWVWRSNDFRTLTSPQPATYFTIDFTF
jgi:hypothetical protein